MTAVAELLPTRSATPKRTLRNLIATACIKASGWRVEGPPPDTDKCIILAVPHTATADGFWMVANGWYWDLKFNWLAKHTLFEKTWARLALNWLGAIPVDRRAPQGLIGQMADHIKSMDSLFLVIAPEGTRKRRDYWKSGFYHIARQANVPVVLTLLDYERKVAGFGPCFYLTGDVTADMDRIRAFYADVTGKYPEKFTPPKLREEDAEEATEAA